ncbi:MAG: hypothetical protein IH590_10405, partial [Aquamicrobium sp.]|nr:hypothetical protein [Aquamicrobium sp.]
MSRRTRCAGRKTKVGGTAMTFHSRSVVEFGLFYSRISESLLSGSPLAATLELVRMQLDATAAALQIEDRWAAGQPQTFLVDEGRAVEAPAARLAE